MIQLHLEKKRKEEFYMSLAIEIMHLHYGKITARDMHAQNLHHALDFNSLLI